MLKKMSNSSSCSTVPLTMGDSWRGQVTLKGKEVEWMGWGLPSRPTLPLCVGRSQITEDSRLILLDRWLRGLTSSLCLAAELSRQEENSGG